MKELNEFTEELHRRVELKTQTRRQHRRQALAACVPLVLVLIVGAALAWPRLAERFRGERTQDGRDGVISAGVDAAGQAPDEIPELAAEQKEALPEPDGDAAGTLPHGTWEQTDDPESEWNAEGIIPSDFCFRFAWGCYGISSYDSESGKLVKTTDATHPEDYVTTHALTQEEQADTWRLLSALRLEDYPAVYDPYNAPNTAQRVTSEPSRDLILSVWANVTGYSVSCREICLGGTIRGYDEQARAFLAACDKLERLLTGTPEWKALPDYEFYYE